MKVPFDIKYRPQIESGEYKVVDKDNHNIRIICWDKKSEKKYGYHIVGLVEFGPDHEESTYYTIDGKGRLRDKHPCLFIVTPEQELTEFEKAIKDLVLAIDEGELRELGVFEEENLGAWAVKKATELLELARKELIEEEYTSDPRKTDLYKLGKAEALKDLPRWRKIKERDLLPCRAYLYNLAYEVENNFLGKYHVDGFLVPNEAVQVGCDTWYLSVDEIKNLPKED